MLLVPELCLLNHACFLYAEISHVDLKAGADLGVRIPSQRSKILARLGTDKIAALT